MDNELFIKFRMDYDTLCSFYGKPNLVGLKHPQEYLAWTVEGNINIESWDIDCRTRKSIKPAIYEFVSRKNNVASRNASRNFTQLEKDRLLQKYVVPLYKNKTAAELILYLEEILND